MKKHEFPKVEHFCSICGGDGLEDVSYHGSPQYENCQRCNGKKNVIYYREMTVDEKLDYLLNFIGQILNGQQSIQP